MNKKIILELPQFRDDILVTFKDLADKETQLREWVDESYLHPYWDSLLMYVLHTLYNDHDLDDEEICLEKIGKVFFNEEEAMQIQKFCEWLDNLIYRIGQKQSDSAYLNHPDWPLVWPWAEECYRLMQENDTKYDIGASWDFWRKYSNDPDYSKLVEEENRKYATGMG